MTEEAPDQSFGKYLAAKKAVVAYGLSEEFEDDQHFTMALSNSALPRLNLPGVSTGHPHVQGFPTFYVSFGAGDARVILSTSKQAAGKFDKLTIVPAQTTVTSDSPESSSISLGASMASEAALITEEESINALIRRMRATLPARYAMRLAARLTELEQAVQEEELDGQGIQAGSLRQFEEFLKAYPELLCPAVSVSPDRNIYASWKSGKDRVFSIHFLPDGKVRFVIFYPNDKHAGDVIRLSGTATADIIMSVAEPHGVESWASDERSGNSRF